MKIIEVPVINADGSLKFTQVITAEEAQILLQFSLNFLVQTGMSVRMMMEQSKKLDDEGIAPDIQLQ